jgi:hypothetical protein
MNLLNRLVCVVFVVALMPTGLRPADAADDDSPAALLERLRAKDKGFDNAILRYTTFGEEVVDFPWWKYPPRNTEEQELMKRGPARIQFRFHEQMVVRGPDTTFTREADLDLKQEKDNWSVTPYQNWGQIGGVVREIIEMTGSGPGNRTFEIRKNDDSASTRHLQANGSPGKIGSKRITASASLRRIRIVGFSTRLFQRGPSFSIPGGALSASTIQSSACSRQRRASLGSPSRLWIIARNSQSQARGRKNLCDCLKRSKACS